MGEWFQSLSILEKVFMFAAGFGGFLFLIRVVLLFAGLGNSEVDAGELDGGGDFDAGADDFDHGDGGIHHDPAEGVADMMSFKLLSFQGITGFSMMFGLVGLAISRAGLPQLVSLAGGTVAGLVLVWVSDKLFRFVGGLQHSGTVDLRNAINEEGTVYLTIPAGEGGKVRLNVQSRLMVLEAISEDSEKIPTDARVRVVGVVNDNVLVVKKV